MVLLLSAGLLWNLDSGVPAFLSWLGFLCYGELFKPGWRRRLGRCLAHILAALLAAADLQQPPRKPRLLLSGAAVSLVGYAALALGRSSKLVRLRAEEKPIFMRYLIDASDRQIFPEGGGLLIRDSAGEVIGAVGVTGDTEDRDEELAAHGIRAAGLKTDADFAHLDPRSGVRLA
mgnify:CR=1 FL=1